MAPAKKTTSSKKKTTAKKPAAKKAAPAVAPEESVAPSLTSLPALPDGFTWEVSADGRFTMVPTGAAPAESAPQVAVSNSRTIRNLRRVPVHLRLSGHGDKPYRVQLERRGLAGDTAEIPAACLQDTAFVRSYQLGLFEIISKAEASDVEYAAPAVGRKLDIIRPADTTVTHKSFETGSKGQITKQTDMMPHNRHTSVQQVAEAVGPAVVSVPGSDPQITAQIQAAAPRRSADGAHLLQSETGRAEHAPDKLVNKGIMPDLPQVAGIERRQQF